MNREIKYINKRIEWLKETAEELKKFYKKEKFEIINELSLELLCFTQQIESKIKQLERQQHL